MSSSEPSHNKVRQVLLLNRGEVPLRKCRIVDLQVLGLLYLPFPTASPPMDKVHQAVPGSSNTSERTDLIIKPRAVWSLAERATPSREKNNTILPNGARLRGIFGSMIKTTSPICGLSCNFCHFPRDESVTRYSCFQRVYK
ncbi:hypothetical protein T4A_9773 [Trichinella pseudospiralis]|uniref:Uncharacterized protein n=1 Tax=Trichinella pseudospiralis TaxID=6337 RepID=A0A0V1EJG9_TRIPS|nr:hypothetical protein T4A_9773 [Trichinella pseudospiralis]